jgi:hypothetical protein
MSQQVTASFGTRQQAEAARVRLIDKGVDPAAITIEEAGQGQEAPPAGLFDQLAGLLAPGKAERPDAFMLTASVRPEQLDAATAALDRRHVATPPPPTRLTEQTIELIETAEELVIGTEAVIREEVVLRKRVIQRTRDIHETVRRTEVEVEELPGEEDQSGRKR